MWSSQVESLKCDRGQKISIFCEGKRVTYSEVIELWQDDETFRLFWLSELASAPFAAYFWETPPVTLSTVHKAFEFVLVDSPHLARVTSQPSSFKKYFETACDEVIAFPNLSQDALLVVPCPTAKISVYSHLALFVREAPLSQKHSFWRTVGKVLTTRLNEQPTWVSTSGLGVYWLHVRLDSYPKYYTFNPYKVLG